MTMKPTARLTIWLRAIVKFFAIEDPYNLRVAPFYGMGKSYRGQWPKRAKVPRAVQVLVRQSHACRDTRQTHQPAP